MIEVGFECSIIFFRMEVAACMWQKAPAEEATRQKRKTTVNNIFLYFLIEETNHYKEIQMVSDAAVSVDEELALAEAFLHSLDRL
jgi:hypothetical protein